MFHKRNFGWIVIIVIIIECILISGCIEQTSDDNKDDDNKDDNNEESDFTNYIFTYEEMEISMQYPTSWEKFENPQENVLVSFWHQEGNILMGVFNISVIPGNYSDYDLILYRTTHIENLNLSLSNFTISSDENNTVLAGREAYTLSITFDKAENRIRRKDIWMIEEDRLFLLTYQAEIKNFIADYRSKILQIIDSFEINNPE